MKFLPVRLWEMDFVTRLVTNTPCHSASPLIFGYIADVKTGRFKMISWGVLVFGVAHVLMCAAGAPDLLANGNAKIPYFISIYILAIGAGKLSLFRPQLENDDDILTS